MGENKMSWTEIILSIIFILAGAPSIEEILGQAILENSVGNPFYTGIWLGIKLLPFFGFLGLVDGIARKFGSNLYEFLINVKEDVEELINW